MDRDHCLILTTNLEYAKKPRTDPLQKRTFARNYRQSITKIDPFIRQRKLTAPEVAEINFIYISMYSETRKTPSPTLY